MNDSSIIDGLLAIAGADALSPADQLARFAVDGLVPSAAITPTSIEQLQEVLRFAGEGKLAVVPWGGGTAMSLGNPPAKYDIAVQLGRINTIIEYEPADLTVGVQAGITLAALQERLAREGQFLPLDPPQADRATIGGILATAASGPLRFAYGAPRDLMIGITVAQADGALIHAGGRVVKNVTGYDLGKLYIGSLGTLGIIVEARFKVLPLPVADRTLVFTTDGLDEAVALSFALDRENAGLKALTLLNGEAARSVGLDGPCVMTRVTGDEAAVDAISTQITNRAREMGAKTGDLRQSPESAWEAVRRGGAADGQEFTLSLRASMLPTAVGDFAQAVQASGTSPRPAVAAIVPYGTVTAGWDIAQVSDAVSLAAAAFAAGTRYGAEVWLESAPAEAKEQIDVWGPLPESFPLMRRIKQQYDPDGGLNPGRYIGKL
jgi:glycolate oxidase FAD binding subunit